MLATRTSKALISLVIAVGGLLCPASLLAQHTLRDLQGAVTDRHHEPLRGAVVQVHNEITNSVASFITDRSGRYSFKRLDGETDYKVTATYRGHLSRPKNLSQFSTRKITTINFKLREQ